MLVDAPPHELLLGDWSPIDTGAHKAAISIFCDWDGIIAFIVTRHQLMLTLGQLFSAESMGLEAVSQMTESAIRSLLHELDRHISCFLLFCTFLFNSTSH